jgi:predicted DNA-binding transcriptional regulator YafY
MDLEELRRFGMDIIATHTGHNYYYNLGSREFEMPELKLLVDSVQSAKFITNRKSADLIRKLSGLTSRHEAKYLQRQVVISGRVKTMNESIYYNVDKLHAAIGGDSRIRFKYYRWNVRKEPELRKNGDWYCVSPWALLWDNENYYLVAYDAEDDKIKHYRVDKMRSMSILEARRSKKALEDKTDLAQFSKKTFGMYCGEDLKVRLFCKNHLAGVILDRFGSDIWMVPEDNEHFTAQVTVTVSSQFFGWITAIGKDLKLAGPEEVKSLYRQYLKDILDDE